jgi:hypothetical protein
MTNLLTRDYPCVPDVVTMLKVKMRLSQDQEKLVDLDEIVYEAISEWDDVFQDCEEWYDEEETDVKDSLRDQVLEFLDDQGIR